MADQKTEYPAIELASAGRHGSGSSNTFGYKVEVRTSYHDPMVLDGMVIDHAWRVLHIAEHKSPFLNPAGTVPTVDWDRDMLRHGLVSYLAAEAHRLAFLAYLEAAKVGGTLCIQTRLVKVRFSQSWSTEELGVSEPMSARHGVRADEFKPRSPAEVGETLAQASA